MSEGNGARVTVRSLNDKLALLRQEQKTEHVKTRALVVILFSASSISKVAPYVLGFFGVRWHLW